MNTVTSPAYGGAERPQMAPREFRVVGLGQGGTKGPERFECIHTQEALPLGWTAMTFATARAEITKSILEIDRCISRFFEAAIGACDLQLDQ